MTKCIINNLKTIYIKRYIDKVIFFWNIIMNVKYWEKVENIDYLVN